MSCFKLRPAPTEREHRDVGRRVVHRGRHPAQALLVRPVFDEIDDHLGARCDGTNDLHVQQDFDVRLILCLRIGCIGGPAGHFSDGDFRFRHTRLLEVRIKVLLAKPPAEFHNADGLPCPIDPRGKVV